MSNLLTLRDRSSFSRKYSEYLSLQGDSTKEQSGNRIYACHHADIDDILLDFIKTRQKAADVPLTWKKLQLRAKEAWSALSPQKQHSIGKFTASSGYISAFLKRNNIRLNTES